MLLKFWGTRGSIPAPVSPDQIQNKIIAALKEAGQKKVDLTDNAAIQQLVSEMFQDIKGNTVGGNTTCITVEINDKLIILDAGSGMRELGDLLMNRKDERAKKYGFYNGKGHASIFLTHTHWDHIQGLPFFKPLHIPGNLFDIYHVHNHVPESLARQMEQEFFPLQFNQINSRINFHNMEEGEQINLDGVTVTNLQLKHPGRAYAYRVVADNAIAVLATDGEYKNLDFANMARYSNFYANADALIFDAMFSVRESFVKEDWGHSSALIGADIAREANVKRLFLFHHDPISTDAEIKQILYETREYLSRKGDTLDVFIAQDGMEVNLSNPAFSTDFHIEEWLENGIIFISLSGKLGAHAVEQFRTHLAYSLRTQQTDRVVFQMENLNDLTMAGIRALVDARRDVVSLSLVGMSEHIHRVLELSGTTDFFAIYDTVDELLLTFNAK